MMSVSSNGMSLSYTIPSELHINPPILFPEVLDIYILLICNLTFRGIFNLRPPEKDIRNIYNLRSQIPSSMLHIPKQLCSFVMYTVVKVMNRKGL